MVRTGILLSLLTSLSRLVLVLMAPLLRQSGSASANLLRLILVALTASLEPPPSAGYQLGSARVGRP